MESISEAVMLLRVCVLRPFRVDGSRRRQNDMQAACVRNFFVESTKCMDD